MNQDLPRYHLLLHDVEIRRSSVSVITIPHEPIIYRWFLGAIAGCTKEKTPYLTNICKLLIHLLLPDSGLFFDLVVELWNHVDVAWQFTGIQHTARGCLLHGSIGNKEKRGREERKRRK